MVFEMLRAEKWQPLLCPNISLDIDEIRATLALWKHRQLFAAVDSLFASVKGDAALPSEWKTFADLYHALIHNQTFEQATACSPVCSNIALR